MKRMAKPPGCGNVVLEDAPIPEPGYGEVRVKAVRSISKLPLQAPNSCWLATHRRTSISIARSLRPRSLAEVHWRHHVDQVVLRTAAAERATCDSTPCAGPARLRLESNGGRRAGGCRNDVHPPAPDRRYSCRIKTRQLPSAKRI